MGSSRQQAPGRHAAGLASAPFLTTSTAPSRSCGVRRSLAAPPSCPAAVQLELADFNAARRRDGAPACFTERLGSLAMSEGERPAKQPRLEAGAEPTKRALRMKLVTLRWLLPRPDSTLDVLIRRPQARSEWWHGCRRRSWRGPGAQAQSSPQGQSASWCGGEPSFHGERWLCSHVESLTALL